MEQQKDKIFAVINLGSSYVSGMLASKLPNGRINPISQAKIKSSGSIVHGRIHNITELSQIVSGIIDKISQDLSDGLSISKVYVGLDCQSMRSHTFKAQLQFSDDGVVLEYEHLKQLAQQAKDKIYKGHSVLHITEPRYFVDGRREYKPNGVRCHHIEANYQLITVRKEIVSNVYEVFEKRLGLTVLDILASPIAEAHVSLTREETMLGCAYINMGGGTTSISLYQHRILSALYILPLGGINVTKDLSKLKLLEVDAEKVKLQHGSMDLEVDKTKTLIANNINGTGEKTISAYEVNNYIHARMNEITTNVLTLLKEIDPDMQLSTLVFSGGAIQLNGYVDVYLDKLQLGEFIRQATARPEVLHESASPSILNDYQSVLGLVALATENCVEQPVKDLQTLFDDSDELSPEDTKTSSTLEDDEEENYTWHSPATDPIEDEEELNYEDELDEDEELEEEQENNVKRSSLVNFAKKIGGAIEQLLGNQK